MLWSIVNVCDVFYCDKDVISSNNLRSSNPYDYIRQGFQLENASLFGGQNNVNYNCNFSGNRTSTNLDISNV